MGRRAVRISYLGCTTDKERGYSWTSVTAVGRYAMCINSLNGWLSIAIPPAPRGAAVGMRDVADGAAAAAAHGQLVGGCI